MSARIRIGISGWRYAPWRGSFYPPGLSQKNELAYAASRLPCLEINGSFYSLQRPENYRAWYEATPDDFRFAVKGSRFITHMLRLNADVPLANFFASGVLCLKEKLGPFLWQLPPNFQFDPGRIELFLQRLPRNTRDLAAYGARADRRVRGRTALGVDRNRKVRHAMEIRHQSFVTPEFTALLRRYDVALVVAETARKWPMIREVTTDFVYMRLHGDTELYRSGYSDRALESWAAQIREWAAVTREIYCFFDNTDVKLRAPFDALSLMKKLGIEWTPDPAITAPLTRRSGRPPEKPAAQKRKHEKPVTNANRKSRGKRNIGARRDVALDDSGAHEKQDASRKHKRSARGSLAQRRTPRA